MDKKELLSAMHKAADRLTVRLLEQSLQENVYGLELVSSTLKLGVTSTFVLGEELVEYQDATWHLDRSYHRTEETHAEKVMCCWRNMTNSYVYHIALDGNTTICGVRLNRWTWAMEEPSNPLHDFHKTLCLNCRRTSTYSQLMSEGSLA